MKITIIIVEGSDLSGKTHLIERLSKRLCSGFVLKNAYKPKVAADSKKLFAHYWSILENIIDRKDIVILDRFFPSQAVYSFLRGIDEMNHPEISGFDHYATVMGFLYIQLDTPLKELQLRYSKRGEDVLSLKDLPKVKDRYDEFYNFTTMIKIKVDTREPDWLDKLEVWVNEHQ